MALAVGAWRDWDEPSGIRPRSALYPVAPHSDDDIDALYAALMDVELRGEQGVARESLVARIHEAETARAEEMEAYFRRRGSLDGAEVADLFARIDAFLDAR